MFYIWEKAWHVLYAQVIHSLSQQQAACLITARKYNSALLSGIALADFANRPRRGRGTATLRSSRHINLSPDSKKKIPPRCKVFYPYIHYKRIS